MTTLFYTSSPKPTTCGGPTLSQEAGEARSGRHCSLKEGFWLTSVERGEGRGISLRFSEETNGELRIAKQRIKLKDGEARLSESLADGYYTPRLIVGGRAYLCSDIICRDGQIFAAQISEGELCELRELLCRLAERVDIAERAIRALDEKMGNATLLRL